MGNISSLVNSGKLMGSKQAKHTEGARRSVQVNVPHHLFLKLIELKKENKIQFTTNAMVAKAIENYINEQSV